MAGRRILLSLKHDELKDNIVRLLKYRVRQGGRGSITRRILQRQLTKFLSIDLVLGNARQSVEANPNKAVAAVRRDQAPRSDEDRGDEVVRLSKK